MDKQVIIKDCKKLLKAYKSGKLGQTQMPEDSHPNFENEELRLAYFTLPMALNYQRDSYKLWESALKTFNDKETKAVFDVSKVTNIDESNLKKLLTKHKLALQPNKHIKTWRTICKTIADNFGSFSELIKKADNDFLKLRELIQNKHKKGFPYLSGPKIFNYWSFIIQEYGGIKLKNSEFIEIAPDTHITQCSVKLGIISQEEAESLSKEEINNRWRSILAKSGINPIQMHPPLWFWSKNKFQFELK
jgi:hypothetical protein